MAVPKMKKRSSKEDIASAIAVKMGSFLTPNKREQQPSRKESLTDMAKEIMQMDVVVGVEEQQAPSKIQSHERLDRIIAKMYKQYESMRETFKEYCIAAIEEGFSPNEAWEYIHSRLKDIVPKSTLYRWAEKELPLEAKNITRPRNNSGDTQKSVVIPNWESSKSERSLPQKQLEQGQTEKPGRFNQAPDEYEIGRLQEYDTNYLREIVKSQHDKIATITKAEADKDFIQRLDYQNQTEQDREKDREIMKKISLDDLKWWKVKGYDENFCRYALMKIITEYSRFKDDAERYKRMCKEERYEKDVILRHLKLCVSCFNDTRKYRKKVVGRKIKYVKGVYDRGRGSAEPGSDEYFDAGWVCAKHRAEDIKLTQQFSPMFGTIYTKMAEMVKENKAKD